MFNMVARVHMYPAQCNAAAEQQPEGWHFVPDTILPGYQWAPQWVPARTPTVHWVRSAGRPWVARTTVQHSSTVQKHGKHGSGALAARALVTRVCCAMTDPETKNPLSCSTRTSRCMWNSDWVGDLLKRKNTTGVIVRRSTKERVLTASENKTTFETNCETHEYFHLFINTEMLMIAARTHVDYVGCTSMVFHSSARLLRMLWRA